MNTIIRTHVNNNTRLNLLEREIISWFDKQLNTIGRLFIVDDFSSMHEEVRNLCLKYSVEYKRAHGISTTINGLVESLKLERELNDSVPALHCVDDAVFGIETKSAVLNLVNQLPFVTPYGTIGLFACYPKDIRDKYKVANTGLWKIDSNLLYALVSHIYSPELIEVLIKDWGDMLTGVTPRTSHQDDIWVAMTCARLNLNCYNTNLDYAQHTGMGNSTFNSIEVSDYRSTEFIGE